MKTILLNSSIKPATKAQAFTLITEALQQRDGDNCTLSAAATEALFKYFAPAKPTKPKYAWQWVAKAVAKQDTRVYLTALYSNGTTLYGTDGHRVHWAPTELEAGFYCPRTCERMEDQGKFPEIERVINVHRPKYSTRSLIECEVTAHNATRTGPIIKVEVGEGVCVNQDYLLQALIGAENFVNLQHGDEYTSVRGKSKFGEFVIMPIKS